MILLVQHAFNSVKKLAHLWIKTYWITRVIKSSESWHYMPSLNNICFHIFCNNQLYYNMMWWSCYRFGLWPSKAQFWHVMSMTSYHEPHSPNSRAFPLFKTCWNLQANGRYLPKNWRSRWKNERHLGKMECPAISRKSRLWCRL